MKTIEIISMIWAVLTAFYILMANISGVNILFTLLIKLMSLITIIWFGYKLIQLLP